MTMTCDRCGHDYQVVLERVALGVFETINGRKVRVLIKTCPQCGAWNREEFPEEDKG